MKAPPYGAALSHRVEPCVQGSLTTFKEAMVEKKTLQMRKLTRQEIGKSRLESMSLLAASGDPFTGVCYELAMEPSLACAAEASERFGRKITFAPVLNRLLAVAIDENPVFNQVVFGGGMYQVQGLHISNLCMLPGRELALAVIVIDNPHRKELADIQQELLLGMVRKTREHASPKNKMALAAAMLFFRLRLNFLVSQRLAFTAAFERGYGSNIFVSYHDYGGPSPFNSVKCIAPVGRAVLRIHACPMGRQPYIDEAGAVSARETLKLTVLADHRVVNGIDFYRLGRTLQRLFASPRDYLL